MQITGLNNTLEKDGIMKRVFSFFMAVVFLASVSTICYATTEAELSKTLLFEEVKIGSESFLVPVVVSTEKQVVATRSGAKSECTEIAQYYLPVTEEGKEYNNSFVSSAMRNPRSSGVSSDSYPDPKNYLQITTYIRYTISGGYFDSTWISDYMVLIDNVAITKYPDNILDGGMMVGASNPTVRIVCRGYTLEPGGAGMDQDTTCQAGWGTQGVNTPSSWVPVIRGEYSDGYIGFAAFDFTLIYDTEVVECSFTHTLAK